MTRITRRSTLALMASAALPLPFIRPARAEEATLNLYNWADFFGETTIEDFQAETGITVNYDTFSSVEESEAKMLVGGTGYDLVATVGSSIPYLSKAGLFAPLDRALLPSWGNLDPAILSLLTTWDPGNTYGFPYTWGSVGLALNLGMVRERLPNADLTSLDLIFKPENAAALADCGISFLDSPTDVIPLTLAYLGLDPETSNPDDLKAVADTIAPVRPHIRTFDNTNVVTALAGQDICVANMWSGDFALAQARAAEAGITAEFTYVVPVTGAPAWVGAFAIPADAPHPGNAHRFLEFLLRPEVMAGVTNYTYYATGNAAAKPFIRPEILANPAIYPDAAATERLWTQAAPQDDLLRAYSRLWSQIKSG
jgi:putrescine transport system substrate-binding protein